ncbi:MAG: phosphodiesterase [marine bacterium B5-7]|nr:MAG: phosphodiesterase [marine bacterium B5-7]
MNTSSHSTHLSDIRIDRDNIVDFLDDIINRRGAEAYLGEPLTISAHMLQCAQLAENEDAGDEMIVAALLHDIGHFTSEFPADAYLDDIDNLHEAAGARVVEPFFPKVVVDCVRHHVEAKRYLCATEPEYTNRLSHASVLSLNLQGGPMGKSEVDTFESQPNFEAIVRVRRWDDEAKVSRRKTPPFEHYLPVLRRVVKAAVAQASNAE